MTGIATESFYGSVQLALTLAIMPLVAYIVGGNMLTLRDGAHHLATSMREKELAPGQKRDGDVDGFENPLGPKSGVPDPC